MGERKLLGHGFQNIVSTFKFGGRLAASGFDDLKLFCAIRMDSVYPLPPKQITFLYLKSTKLTCVCMCFSEISGTNCTEGKNDGKKSLRLSSCDGQVAEGQVYVEVQLCGQALKS